MGSFASEAQKDESVLEDSLNIVENPNGEDDLLKSETLLSQRRQQCSVLSNSGKWLQIVKNGPKGSFSRATNKIPRHLVTLDEKYLRRCLEMINLSAFKSASCSLSLNLIGSKMSFSSHHFDSPVIPKENVARLVFDLPLVDDSGSPVISRAIIGCRRATTHMDKPLLNYLESLDGDDMNSRTRRDDNGENELVLCDGMRKIEEKYTPDSQFKSNQSGNMPKKAVSLSSINSMSSSSSSSLEQSSSCWSPSSTVSHGALQFTMKDNKTPHFVFSLDDQKEVYEASLSTVGSGFDRSSLDYSYLIHLKKGRGSEQQYLVGKLNVSTLISVSPTNGKTVERQFVLFSSGGNPQLLYQNDIRKSRGLPKKVIDALKSTTRASRQRSISRFSRTSSIPDFCSWEPFQEQDHDVEPVSLLDNDLPSNLETSAIVVKEQFPIEEEEVEKVGGWGMKFLKKTPLARTKEPSKNSNRLTSMDVMIPSGIHGGPRNRNSGPSSLIQRWRTGGSCDCSGWDLGCPLTVLNGQAHKGQNEDQYNLFEFFKEGSNQGNPELRIMNVRDDLYFIQCQANISVLQSFSISLAYIHSQSQRLRPWSRSIQKV